MGTFGEPKSQEIPVDYMQASKMHKITGITVHVEIDQVEHIAQSNFT